MAIETKCNNLPRSVKEFSWIRWLTILSCTGQNAYPQAVNTNARSPIPFSSEVWTSKPFNSALRFSGVIYVLAASVDENSATFTVDA